MASGRCAATVKTLFNYTIGPLHRLEDKKGGPESENRCLWNLFILISFRPNVTPRAAQVFSSRSLTIRDEKANEKASEKAFEKERKKLW